MSNKEKKKITTMKAPNPILILVAILLFCAVATYIVPAGVFDRIADPSTGRMIVDPNSFHYVEQNPVKLFDIFKSLTLGLQKSSDVIFFLFIIGGAFGIMDATGAIRSGMGNMVKKMAGKELFLIPVCMLIFGMGSCFAANYEEFLVFVPLSIPICIAMGFDSLTALGIVFGAAGAGYAGGCTNAFTVGVAQSISGLPMFSGIGLRFAAFVALLGVSIVYVMFRAIRVKKNPMSSAMYEIDRKREDAIDLSSVPALTKRHILVLIIFVGGIIGMVVGVLEFGFYIDELAALFLVVGILAGVCGGLTPNQIVDEFLKGCNNLLFANMMIGLCSATTIIMTNANIMDTIIHALAQTLVGLPPMLTACGMFVVQDLINLLVPSGSGQAAITMPIMAPLADLIGVTRQTAVLAFQFGDSFTNVITPTGGTIMAALAMAKVPYSKWFKYLIPLFFLWWLVAFALLIYATISGYGPF